MASLTSSPATGSTPHKVSIVGAGEVGATVAYALLIRGVAKTIAIYDLNEQKTQAQILDLRHGVQFTPMTDVIGGSDIEACRDSDIVVITAGAKQKPGQSRLELTATNVKIVQSMLPQLLAVAPHAIYLIVSNPVDVLTYAAIQTAAVSPRQILGSGTVLDTSRFRFLVAEKARVAVQNVHGYIVGEHGDSEIPLWSSTTIGPVPLLDWQVDGHHIIDEDVKAEIRNNVVGAAGTIIEGKGATNYAIGLSTSRIVEAILKDEGWILPVSSLLDNYKGVSNICLSVPTIIGREGVRQVLDVPFSDDELAGFKQSAQTVANVARNVGL